jgi:hypothetical protein
MSDDKRYNGWANYETWAVNLWITNEEGSDSYWREKTQEIADDEGEKDAAAGKLAEALKDEIRDGEGAPDLGASLYADLLGAALSEVDWYEIAEAFLSDVDWPEEEEEIEEAQ